MKKSKTHNSGKCREAGVPRMEPLESRLLLSTGGFLQGVAFIDSNLNDAWDAGESVKVGSIIQLYNSDGSILLDQTATDANGAYLFDNLAPATYRLVEQPPLGFDVNGVQILSQLNPATAVSGGLEIEVTVVDPATVTLTYDNNVFFLRNKWENLSLLVDGIPISGGVGQIPISLASVPPPAQSQFLTFCTDPFNDLTAGVNIFTVVPNTQPAPPANVAAAGRIGYLYNRYGQADLSRTDGVGLQIAMWEILYDTDENFLTGDFQITGVIGPTPQAQLDASILIGNFYLADSLGKSEPVTFLDATLGNVIQGGNQSMLATGSLNFANIVDFGETEAAIGDFVWEDLNANGIQDAGEPGIPGVTVNLINCDSTLQVGSTTTDGSGLYLFSGLTPGNYHVQFVLPGGYVFSPKDQGVDDAVDSDADTTTGDAICTTLVGGETDLTWDAGMYRLAAIGDFVWSDLNNDGLQDVGEPGIDGVLVRLYDAGNSLVNSMLTAGGGLYLFTGLTPGSYHVEFDAVPGFVRSPANVGVNDAIDSDANAAGVAVVTTLISGETDLTWDAGYFRSGEEPDIDVEKFVKKLCKLEGFTPGFWKQCQHFQYWVGYNTTDKVETVFGVDVPGSNPTLLQALSTGGGGVNAFLRQAVAALLNASNDNVNYFYSVDEVKSLVQQAFSSGRFEYYKGLFETQNSLEGDIKKGCTQGFGIDADEAPGLVVPVGTKVIYTYVVTNTGDTLLANIVLTDDNATPGNPGDDFNPAPLLSGGFNVGDVDHDNLLDLDESWLYTAIRTILYAKQYTNTAVVVGTPVNAQGEVIGENVTDDDPANVKGVKTTCGDKDDDDDGYGDKDDDDDHFGGKGDWDWSRKGDHDDDDRDGHYGSKKPSHGSWWNANTWSSWKKGVGRESGLFTLPRWN